MGPGTGKGVVELELTDIGDGVGVVLPGELLDRLGWREGDALSAVETPGGLRLSLNDPEHEARMAVARRIMEERREVLRELAKAEQERSGDAEDAP